jgi:hypothetical protein
MALPASLQKRVELHYLVILLKGLAYFSHYGIFS